MAKLRFLDPENEAHRRVWVLLIIEYIEFSESLEDTIEVMGMDNVDGVSVDGQLIYHVLRTYCGVTDSELMEIWTQQYDNLLEEGAHMLEPTSRAMDMATEQNKLDTPPDEPWIDPAGGIHFPGEDPAKQYE